MRPVTDRPRACPLSIALRQMKPASSLTEFGRPMRGTTRVRLPTAARAGRPRAGESVRLCDGVRDPFGTLINRPFREDEATGCTDQLAAAVVADEVVAPALGTGPFFLDGGSRPFSTGHRCPPWAPTTPFLHKPPRPTYKTLVVRGPRPPPPRRTHLPIRSGSLTRGG